MGNVETNAWLAVVLGAAAAVVLFVPVVAVTYRRSGAFSLGDLVRSVAVPIYACALATYTLLPLPDRDDVRCTGRQTEPLAFVGDIERAWQGSITALVVNPVFGQVALNVLLFVPLGWFVRTVLSRGVVVATVLGFAVSLLIETTQLTGLWGIYDCAYRVFDVDDLVVNTGGAVLGALMARALLGRRRPAAERPVHPPTAGRRLLSLACDGVAVVLLGAGAVVLLRAWHVYGLGHPVSTVDLDLQRALQYGVPATVQALFVFVGGRSLGEWVTEIDTHGGRGPRWVALSTKYVLGAGGFVALVAAPQPWGGWALLAFAVLSVGSAFTRDHRGLANTVAGLSVHVDDAMTRSEQALSNR